MSSETPGTPYSLENSPNFPSQAVSSVKDGTDIASGRRASRRRTGPLSREQRKNAAFIRKLGACDDRRRRKIACRPEHRNKTWENVTRKRRKPLPSGRPTPLPCVFAFAGCKSTILRENEWKRHIHVHHILSEYWICEEDGCASFKNDALVPAAASGLAPNTSDATAAHTAKSAPRSNLRGRSSSTIPLASSLSAVCKMATHGAIFRRKDYYTDHMKRAHNLKGSPYAQKTRCKLPVSLPCPKKDCTATLDIFDSWMEHVAMHLKGAVGQTDTVLVGINGKTDHPFIAWAAEPDVAIIVRLGERWVLNTATQQQQQQ